MEKDLPLQDTEEETDNSTIHLTSAEVLERIDDFHQKSAEKQSG